MDIAVIGAGSWGTALSQVLASNGHDVRLWARKDSVVEGVNERHRNPRYLTDAELSPRIVATASTEQALAGADAVVVVTPSSIMRETARSFEGLVGTDAPIIVCSKGVEEGSGLLPVEVFEAELGNVAR